ncbi:uncharacterized protein BT62DRAFT_920793 [Guyanagaster necrorhizus]|uniref:Uncharacterized protein n=1 Tax=Guyanagaster necrorhizus TaxID=856835 RepID=A0A9P7VS84_9AGAR|nr:uncharacterized protein BT62DRAFT_920793 [Guyanagaster necrorhizus MCA 3950]KAG7445031.1 hypothetical protein BT62DRAFT_920793 [Guyanagaster necrorhizus MCA 3950]
MQTIEANDSQHSSWRRFPPPCSHSYHAIGIFSPQKPDYISAFASSQLSSHQAQGASTTIMTCSDYDEARIALRARKSRRWTINLSTRPVDAELTPVQTDIVETRKKGKHANMFDKTSNAGQRRGRMNNRLNRVLLVPRNVPERRRLISQTGYPPTDFFGRLITSSAGAVGSTNNKVVEKKYRVAYKFIEGNSAAVRKPLKVRKDHWSNIWQNRNANSVETSSMQLTPSKITEKHSKVDGIAANTDE